MGKPFTRPRLVFLGAVLLGLAACSTDASSPPASSPSATSPPNMPATAPAPVTSTGSPTESPNPAETSPTETVRPQINIPEPEKYPEMANDDLEGAAAAAHYFLDLYGYAYETGSLESWKKISGPDCAVCAVVTKQVEDYYGRGEWFENFGLVPKDPIVYYPTDEFPGYLVLMEVLATPYRHYNATGDLLGTVPEVTYPRYGIFVEYINPYEWVVTGVGPGESHE